MYHHSGAVVRNVFGYCWHHGDTVKRIATMKTFPRNHLSFFLNNEQEKRYLRKL
jgi:hypothetical protein